MGFSTRYARRARIEFSASEFAGALGDSITVLPILIALAALTDVSMPHALLGFAVVQIVSGLHYGLPMSVEPMKLLAALTIAGSISAPELSAAGLLAGAFLLALGVTGTLGRIETLVGRPVVRGIQLSVALVLFETAFRLGVSDLRLAGAGLAAVLLVTALGRPRLGAVVVVAGGAALALAATGVPSPRLPPTAVAVPALAGSLTDRTIVAALGQLGMTLGNAALATSLLISDLFDRNVSPDDLATSMGAANLVAVPLGAIPMCHGSGGLAGKHAFGARTPGANLLLGGLYALAALFVGGGLLAAFPIELLGVLLVTVAGSLARAALRSRVLWVTLSVGVLGLLTNVGLAFVVGVVAHQLLVRRSILTGQRAR